MNSTIKFNVGKRVGEALVSRGVLEPQQLERAIEIQSGEPVSVRRRLADILIDDIGAERHETMRVISEMYAFREVLPSGEISDALVENIKQILDDLPDKLEEDLVHRNAVPYDARNGNLVLACADPTDPAVTTLINKMSFKQHELVYCRLETIKSITDKVYQQKNEFLDLLDEFEYEEPQIEEENELDEDQLDAEINQSMLNSLVEGMLVEAVRKDVSDIHVIPAAGNKTDIYFRLDGKLQLWHAQGGLKPEALSAVVKDKSRNVDRFERASAQDGFIQRKVDGINIRYRVSILPIVGEEFDRKLESIVIRVLDDRKVITDLGKLGLQNQAFKDFNKAIRKPSGIVIITGPTGSGKSTTLVAALYSVVDPSVNVLTVEEPVEYLIKGVRQLKISESMSFDKAMRGILRHDPDIVLVGEIRDLLTAEIAIKLANTGHLTFSTLHTNDAPSAVARLFKMGVEPFLIANAVNLVMAQRLVRKLCEKCKRPIQDLDPELPRSIGFTDQEIAETTFYEAVGCEACNRGFKGRVAIMEALYFDKAIKRIIFESGDDIDEDQIREQAVKNGMLTLRASGRGRIQSGITTIDEVLAITVED